MAKERLMNDTVVDLERLPQDQLITLLGEVATRSMMAQADERKVVDEVGRRLREMYPDGIELGGPHGTK